MKSGCGICGWPRPVPVPARGKEPVTAPQEVAPPDAPEAPDTIRQEAETIRAQDGRLVEAGSIASVWTVRHGERCEVVAHLYPVILSECDDYAEARAIQERVQEWLDSGRA